jgi:hypothetical protein
MTALEWRTIAGYELLGSDRVAEQHTSSYGKFNLWVERHQLDEKGKRLNKHYWVFWFSNKDFMDDVFVCETQFSTMELAYEAAERFVERLR